MCPREHGATLLWDILSMRARYTASYSLPHHFASLQRSYSRPPFSSSDQLIKHTRMMAEAGRPIAAPPADMVFKTDPLLRLTQDQSLFRKPFAPVSSLSLSFLHSRKSQKRQPGPITSSTPGANPRFLCWLPLNKHTFGGYYTLWCITGPGIGNGPPHM